MGNDEVLKKLKKSTSQVEDFINEMEKMIADNKQFVSSNRAVVAKSNAESKRQQSYTKYAKQSLARMRQETRAIEEEMEMQAKENAQTEALVLSRVEIHIQAFKKH